MKNTTLALTSSIAIAAVAAISCAEQNGTPPPVPMGCEKAGAVGTNYWSCVEPAPMADLCCFDDNPLATHPYLCWADGQPGTPPPYCDEDPFDPSSGAGTDGGTGGSDTGGSCSAECPEDFDGTCPGHAEWDRGIMIWGIYKPKKEGGGIDQGANPSLLNLDPECADSIGICFAYMDPDDIPSLNASMSQQMLENCNGLTNAELAAIGIDVSPAIGQYGWGLVDHACVLGTALETTHSGLTLTDNATTGESACLAGGAWTYAGFCSESDCPFDMSGTSDGLDGGTTGVESYDCSPLESSDITVKLRTDPRTVVVRGDAADMFLEDVYAPFYHCSDALFNSGGKLWDLPSSSFLVDWGLVEDDVLHSVEGSTSNMVESAADAINNQRPFDVQIAHGSSLIDYTVEIID